jgi:hypothetical protein
VQRKEEMRQHAAGTLHNLSVVLDNHGKIEDEEENERMREYVQRQTKKMKYFQKWQKIREEQWESLKSKHEGKLGEAKHKMEGAKEELERLQ